jgi:hypothetical protein
MSFNLRIIRTSDFIRLNGNGEYDREQTRAALRDVATTCALCGIDRALLDIRTAHSDMTMADLRELAAGFREMGFRKHHRMAILHRSRSGERVEFFSLEPGERAAFFAMCASQSGWNVQAFDDFEHAMEWLGSAEPLE